MRITGTRRRRFALSLLALPILVYSPFRYWVFHHAGGWFVAADLEPEHRAMHLGETFILILVAFCAVVVFLSLLLLYLDGYRRKPTGWLLVPSALAALLGAAVLAITGGCYFRFS